MFQITVDNDSVNPSLVYLIETFGQHHSELKYNKK